jgi:hypothetical protein
MTDTPDNDAFDYSIIPGMPSDAQIEASIRKTSGPAHWRRPEATGPAPDLSNLSETGRNRVLAARLQLGPGPHANPFQLALFNHHKKLADIDNREKRLMDELLSVSGYDPNTGEGISALSEDRRVKITYELSAIARERAIHDGPGGKARLDKAMAEAVQREKARHKQAWITEEAKRRAAHSAVDAEIERLADGFRKVRPNP